jgi:hypothetical protein
MENRKSSKCGMKGLNHEVLQKLQAYIDGRGDVVLFVKSFIMKEDGVEHVARMSEVRYV